MEKWEGARETIVRALCRKERAKAREEVDRKFG